tara:strand:- start:272 stop:514 length:243 start_codon:yes stop_codon:yes gene_type:complete
MRPEYATPADFTAWEAKAKTMTFRELVYTVRDCQEAEKAMRGWNPVKEGFYSDQASTFGMELTRRQRHAQEIAAAQKKQR